MIAAFVALLVAVIFFGFRSYLKADIRRLRCREFSAKRFQERCRPLITDPETPDAILSLLTFINEEIENPRGARHLISSLSYRDRQPTGIESQQDELIGPFLARRPELKDPFVHALAGGLMAITYGDLLWGWLARLMIGQLLTRHPEIAGAVAENAMHATPGRLAAA